jgi:hypothetical protein
VALCTALQQSLQARDSFAGSEFSWFMRKTFSASCSQLPVWECKMDIYARRLFTIAAAYNFICSVPGFLSTTPLAGRLGLTPAVDPTDVQIALVLVVTFGWGYWKIAQDPVVNRPIIVLGIIGKILVALVGYLNWLTGHASSTVALVVTGDALFAALFYHYLRHTMPGGTTVKGSAS